MDDVVCESKYSSINYSFNLYTKVLWNEIKKDLSNQTFFIYIYAQYSVNPLAGVRLSYFGAVT